ncbi:MAG: conjugal transfer protein TraH [Alphaproteobacteria bacterium]|nr:conjugal transfer protein TraH [Alphaproteobacteria bacterium]
MAWKAIKKNAFLSADHDLAEFFMTLSGTIVSQRIQQRGGAPHLHLKYYPSKSSDSELISALLTGHRDVQIYKCDTHEPDKCLNPQLRSVNLREKALSHKIGSMLDSIKSHLWHDKSLSEPQKAFVNSTMIPILKIIAVEMAFKQGGSPISIGSYQEAIAHDILLQYLDEVMELVWTSVTQLKQTQINDQMIEKFRAGVASSRKRLFAERTKMFEQISLTLEAIERTHQIEAKLQNMFISTASSQRSQ